MLLHAAKISGFRSFRKPVEVFISPRTTILIGPNDHGKTNLLLAVDKLNPSKEFLLPEVNNRIREDEAHIAFQIRLDDADLSSVETGVMPLIEAEILSEKARFALEAGAPEGGTEGPSALRTLSGLIPHSPLSDWWNGIKKSRRIDFIRRAGKPLELQEGGAPEAIRATILSILQPLMPKVFFFTEEALRQLPDTVNTETLETNEVMQGVFRLAGIWESRRQLLSGNTRQNLDDLREASKTLTTEIRKNWTQGKDLEFYLEYVGSDIRLTVKDSARTVTAVAERSQGFTAYFAMRMLLVARTDQAQPNGYIFMFDEPGLNLHPKGQVDLQNVFEDIARTNQIIYSTHSVFLINKNYPERNHLIYKNEQGSNIDNKPFVGGWAKVKEHLGLYLSANFLFADKILLAEGSTDEIYIPLILQGLVERGSFNGDLNGFAIRSSLNSKEMLAVASIYVQEERSVTVLVDGDDEGRKRKAKIEAWADRTKQECAVLTLSEYKTEPCSIEDFLEPTLYIDAVVAACKQAVDAGYIKPQKEAWPTELKRLLGTADGNAGENRKSLGKRVETATTQVFGEPISDNAIAMRYSELLQLSPAAEEAASRLERYWSDESLGKLAAALLKALKLPTRGDVTGIPFAG